MKRNKLQQQGFSLIELMIATVLGLIVTYAVLQIYLSQTQIYKASASQDLITNVENAIYNLVTPVIRSAGFLGCGTISTAVSVLNAGGPDPIGSLNTLPTIVKGYTSGGGTFTLSTVNPANSTNAGDWTPTLYSTLVGQVETGNDVIIVFGSAPGSYPLAVTTIDTVNNFFAVQSTVGTTTATGQFGAVSDCVKAAVFQITGVGSTNITHNAGSGILQNASSVFPVTFAPGSQFVQLQQTAFFVGQGQGGESALMRAISVGNTWTIQPIVPGVEIMKVQYGIGSSGTMNQYVTASAVTNWSQVYSIRIAFLIAGQPGSGGLTTTQYSVLDTVVTVPADNRLRHVFEMTIQLRNAIS